MAVKIIQFPAESLRLAKQAEFYASQNDWRVVPLHNVAKLTEEDGSVTYACSCQRGGDCPTPGKHPRITNFVNQATSDVEIIRGWWKQWPKANVGIYIDARDGNRIAVVDVDIKPKDGKNGAAVIKAIAAEQGIEDELPPTLTCITPSGGRHYYYQYTEEQRVPGGSNFRQDLGLGLDIFISHMLVVPASSVGYAKYKWDVNQPKEIAAYPKWLERRKAGRPKTKGEEKKTAARLSPSNPIHVARIRHALQFLDNTNRDIWYKVGFALSRWFRKSDAGFEMYNEWSKTADNYDPIKTRKIYDDQADATPVIGEDITIGWLLHEAQQNKKWVDFVAEDELTDKPETFHYYMGNEHLILKDILRIFEHCPIYQLDNRLIRVAVVDDKIRESMEWQPEGSAFVQNVTGPELRNIYLPHCSHFWICDQMTGKARLGLLPGELAHVFTQAGNWPGAPRFRAVAEHAVVRDNGSLATANGFDVKSGMYLHKPCDVSVPEKPKRRDAERAMADLLEPFSEYRFIGGDDQANAVLLAFLLTLGTRHLYPSAPAFAAVAPKAGCGKTKLVQAAVALWAGKIWPVISLSRDSEEIKKLIFSSALAGNRFMIFDNVKGGRVVNNETINAVLGGSTSIMDRMLGESRILSVPNIATYIFTGNNIAFGGDMARRVMRMQIDPVVRDPTQRAFSFDPVTRMIENRETYVSAALTIVRGWVEAGKPDHPGHLPTFERWSEWVRNIVMWLTGSDPAASVYEIMAEDDTEDLVSEAANAIVDMAMMRKLYYHASVPSSMIDDAKKFNNDEWEHEFKPGDVVDALMSLGDQSKRYEQALNEIRPESEGGHREGGASILHHRSIGAIFTRAPGFLDVPHRRTIDGEEIGYEFVVTRRKKFYRIKYRKI